MLNLYRFDWYMRGGGVQSLIVATPEELQVALGQTVNLGEVNGKHSDVHGTLEQKDFTLVTSDQDFIAKALELKVIPFGINPLEYITCAECRADPGGHELSCSKAFA